jgi:hypothetical protein
MNSPKHNTGSIRILVSLISPVMMMFHTGCNGPPDLYSRSTSDLIQMYQSDDKYISRQAYLILLTEGPRFAPDLVEIIRTGTPKSSEVAANLLRRMKPRPVRLISELMELTRDKNPLIRADAIWALDGLGTDSLILLPVFTRAAYDVTDDGRQKAVWCIYRRAREVPEGVDILLKIAEDSKADTTVRTLCCSYLSKRRYNSDQDDRVLVPVFSLTSSQTERVFAVLEDLSVTSRIAESELERIRSSLKYHVEKNN